MRQTGQEAGASDLVAAHVLRKLLPGPSLFSRRAARITRDKKLTLDVRGVNNGNAYEFQRLQGVG